MEDKKYLLKKNHGKLIRAFVLSIIASIVLSLSKVSAIATIAIIINVVGIVKFAIGWRAEKLINEHFEEIANE